MKRSSINSVVWLTVTLLLYIPAVHADNWQVIQTQSHIGFTAQWEDMPFDGVFHRYSTTIDFNPSSPEAGRFDAIIYMASANTNNEERDEALHLPEWFGSERFPVAKFSSTEIKHVKGADFQINGKLTIKGVTNNVLIPFSWHQQNGQATFIGKTTIDRTAFHIGSGEWATDQSIRFNVLVQLELKLSKQ